MKKIYTLVFACLLSQAWCTAQGLYRYPFVAYLGSGLETTKINIYGGIPYDGIGKKVLLEQLPETWFRGFQKINVPTTNFVDAFGTISGIPVSKPWSNNPNELGLRADRFGNLGFDFSNNLQPNYQVRLFNQFHLQKRWQRDANHNGIVDFHPGNRAYWGSSASFQLDRLRIGAGLRYLHATEWGGETGYRAGDPGNPSYGYSLKANHLQLLLDGSYDLSHSFYRSKFEWLVDLKRHHQHRSLGAHEYEGTEKVGSGYLTYTYQFVFAQVGAGVQYTADKLEESLGAFSHRPEDRFWRYFGHGRTYIGKKVILKGFANVEKRRGGDWSFLPSGQLDIQLGKDDRKVLSLIGQTGQRAVKPLSYHFEWLAVADGIDFRAKPYERLEKLGLAFQWKSQDLSWISKLTLDRSRFRDKSVISLENGGKTLVFSSLDKPLHRSALEWLGYKKLDEEGYWDAHLLYRFEVFSERDALPFQAAHSAQLRGRFRKNGFSAEVHHTLVSPQNLQPLSPSSAPFYQRTDFTFGLAFDKLAYQRPLLRKMEAWIRFDNVLPFNQNKKSQRETGLLLYPLQQDILWPHPSVGNFSLGLDWRF